MTRFSVSYFNIAITSSKMVKYISVNMSVFLYYSQSNSRRNAAFVIVFVNKLNQLLTRVLLLLKNINLLLGIGDQKNAVAIQTNIAKAKTIHYNVILKSTLQHTLTAFQSNIDFDIILIDSSLFDLSDKKGYDSIRKIEPAIPIIILIQDKDTQLGLNNEDDGNLSCFPIAELNSYWLNTIIINAIDQNKREKILQQESIINKMIIDNASDAIITINNEGKIIWFNNAACDLFGYEKAEIVNKDLIMLIPKKYRESHLRAFEKFIASGANRLTRSSPAILEGVCKNGEMVPIELTLSGIRISKTLYITGFIRDISKRIQAQIALEESRQQLFQSQKMDAIGKLAGEISHDFNNLLTSILVNTSILQKHLENNNKGSAILNEIVKTSKKGSSLLNQLLSFSKNRIEVPAAIDVNEVILNLKNMLDLVLNKGVGLEITISRDPGYIMIDKIRFEQLLLNLVINSNQAMVNSGTILIKTELSQSGNILNEEGEAISSYNVMISVDDTGTGMDIETLNHMYEPFYTTKKNGTGLGLTIVYNIVRQHGGEISINSNVNVGTSFKVTFPGIKKSGKKAVEVLSQNQFKLIEDRNHILLIEDNDSIRNMIYEILTEEGFSIEIAANPQEAKEILEKLKYKPNLIISDIRMPGMNGVDFIKSIMDDFLDTKILFITGFYDVNIPDILEDLPFEIIHKPFQIEEIVIKVKQMINQ